MICHQQRSLSTTVTFSFMGVHGQRILRVLYLHVPHIFLVYFLLDSLSRRGLLMHPTNLYYIVALQSSETYYDLWLTVWHLERCICTPGQKSLMWRIPARASVNGKISLPSLQTHAVLVIVINHHYNHSLQWLIFFFTLYNQWSIATFKNLSCLDIIFHLPITYVSWASIQ